METRSTWGQRHFVGGNMIKNNGITEIEKPLGEVQVPNQAKRAATLQPMFVTNRTSISEIDQHLATASTRIVVVTIEHANSHGHTVVDHVGQKYADVRMVLVCDGSIQEVLSMSFKPGVWACVGRHSSVETLRVAIDSVA
ncbi:MAG: hypothetical protein R3194_09610, partial [Limnobacter sp.]|nr:hypothetical protein [Limnobacter sp.]